MIRKIFIALLGILFLVAMPVWGEEIYNAVKEGDIAKVQSLLAKRPEWVKAKDKFGITLLYRAAYRGHADIAKLLIAKGADVDAKTKDGYTPLDMATFMGHKDVVGRVGRVQT